MNCNEARQHWNLYHDSEGDAELHFRVNEHLDMCPECAAWFKQQSQLEDLLKEKLIQQPATADLWSQVLIKTGLVCPSRIQSWLWLGAVAASVAVVCVGLVLWQGGSANAADLSKLSAAWHQKVLDGHEPDFRPQSDKPDLEVEKYLRKEVTFPVRCPPRKDADFEVKGAGVCKLGNQPAAYLTGLVNKTPVSVFILPRESLDDFAHQKEALRLEKRHHCREGTYQMVLAVIDRNVVLVIGQTEAQHLEKVLNAYGTYPEHNQS